MIELKKYSKAEVAERTGRGGTPLWIIIRDYVYDVTAFTNEHPGGADVLKEHAGKDATRDFDDVGHSSDARDILAKYKIGEIIEEEKVYDADGKKKKSQVVKSKPEANTRSCLNIITCGLAG